MQNLFSKGNSVALLLMLVSYMCAWYALVIIDDGGGNWSVKISNNQLISLGFSLGMGILLWARYIYTLKNQK